MYVQIEQGQVVYFVFYVDDLLILNKNLDEVKKGQVKPFKRIWNEGFGRTWILFVNSSNPRSSEHNDQFQSSWVHN